MASYQLDLFIDTVVDRFIFKNNQMTLLPCFTFIPKTGVRLYLKQELVFTEQKTAITRYLVIIFNLLLLYQCSFERGGLAMRTFLRHGCLYTYLSNIETTRYASSARIPERSKQMQFFLISFL